MPDKLDELYDALKADGAVQKDRENFRNFMLAPGKTGYENRKKLYDALKADGAIQSGTYEEFRNRLGLKAVKPASSPTPTSSSPVARPASQPTGTPMTDDDKRRMSSLANGISASVDAGNKRVHNQIAYAKGNSGLQVKPVKLGQNRHVVEKPAVGRKSTYITESGNEFGSRAEADVEQNAVDAYKDSMTVSGQLREAEKERERLDGLMRERMKELDEENGGVRGFLRDMANESHGMPGGLVDNNGMDKYRTDERFRQLESASRKNNLAIQTLRDKKNGQMNDFWHSMGATLVNGYTFSDGLSDMNDATALMDAQKRLDTINKKRATGKPLTKEEEAAEAVLRNAARNDQVQGMYGNDYGAWSRTGSMFATSVDMMKDIMLTPGANGIAKGVAGKVAQTLGKGVARVAGEKVATNIVTRGILKGTGILLGAHTAGAVVSNTSGIGHLGGEIGKGVSGNVGIDGKGNYVVENQRGLMNALVDAERTQIGENGSEMFGEFIPGVGGVLKKGLEKIGLSKISNALTNIGKKDWYKQYSALLERGGYNGLPGEAIEEYEGMLFDAMAGNASEAWEQMKDPRTHVDIWLGCATMGALFGAVPMVAQGYHTAQYYRYKHETDMADKVAGYRMTAEKWEPLRIRIDGAQNGEMTDVVLDNIINNPDLHTEEKKAALKYVGNLQKMRGYNIAEANNSDEEAAEATEALNESFRRGHEADGQGRQDIYTELSMQDGVSEEEKQEAWNGVVQRINEDAATQAAVRREEMNKKQHTDGSFHTATLKEKDENGNDKQVFVIDGIIEMSPDGTTVDPVRSHRTVVIYDPATGEQRMIDPTSSTGIQTLGNVTSTEEEKNAIEEERRQFIQAQMDEAQGIVHVAPGEQITLPTGEQASVTDVDSEGENITVQTAEGKTATVLRSDLQKMVDQTRMEDYRLRHESTATEAEAEADVDADASDNSVNEESPAPANGAPAEYTADMEITIRDDDGSEKPAIVTGRVRYENGKFVPDENGQIIEYVVDDEARHDHQSVLDDKVVGYVDDNATSSDTEESAPPYALNDEISLQADDGSIVAGKVIAEEDEDGRIQLMTEKPVNGKQVNMFTRDELNGIVISDTTPAETNVSEGNNSGENIQDGGNSTAEDVPTDTEAQPSALSRIPKDENGTPLLEETDPETAWDGVVEFMGSDTEDAGEYVNGMVTALTKEVETAKKAVSKVKPTADLSAFKQAKAEARQAQATAEARLKKWQDIAAVNAARQKAESDRIATERAEADLRAHEQAVAAEQARQEEELRKREEQAQVGTNAAHPHIKEKWDAALKVEGARNEIVLANGEKISGRYVLVESGAATPSHNPNAEFAKNEGFPVDENGQSVNDRDYERDKDAQAVTRNIAGQYDSRAMQAPVIVSNDGVVLSGNGRTMAGELAAANGTDDAYIEHLKKYGQQYGFTPEQVEGMEHPRVLFVPDEQMPYTAETFAKFNQQEMKGQSKSEQAVKLGKIVDDETFGRITKSINAYDTLGDFYADTAASTNAMQELLKAGAISQAQYAEMFDGDTISSQGREMLENMLIGKAFERNPDAIRQITAFKSVRQSVISALAEISNNLQLGDDYSLKGELAQAIDLVYQARNSGGHKAGERVSSYARQLNLFPFDEGESVADYTNATVLMLADVLNDNRVTQLKKVLTIYNHHAQDAANGQMDLFTGGVESKEDILNYVKSILNYGTEQEQQSAINEAVARRKEADYTVGQRGYESPSAGAGDAGSEAGRGGQGYTVRSGERQRDLSQAEVNAPLSDELNEFSKPFVLSSDGTTVFGEMSEDSGLTAAPIKLSLGENIVDENGANHGYGLLHIEAGHGKQIRAAGFSTVEEFIETVARNYDTIREGSFVADNQTYLLEISDDHNNTLFIQLSRDGSYWNINSAGIFKKKYSRNKKEVFTRPALEPKTNTDFSGVDSGHLDGVTAPAGNSPQTSAGKDTEISQNGKENEQKNSENVEKSADTDPVLKRNEQRKETEQEVAANTEALASETATVASEVESKLPSARSEREVNDLAKNIDDAIDKVNDQLALLGYYEAEPVESDFNEAYGYMRNAEKKAVKNVTELFKTLTKELGISDPVVYDTRGNKQKSVTANIAPAGGDVTMRFMLNRDKGVELYIDFMLEPDYENNRDNLVLKGIMFRPERNLPNGGRDYLRANNFFPVDVTMPQMLQGIRSVCQEWLPAEDYVAMAQRIAAENAGNQQEKPSKEPKSKKKSVSLHEQTIPDLFSGLFGEDELNSKDNDTARTDNTKGISREDGSVGSVPADRDGVLDTRSTGGPERGETTGVSDETGAVADGTRTGVPGRRSSGSAEGGDNLASEAGQPLSERGQRVRDRADEDGRSAIARTADESQGTSQPTGRRGNVKSSKQPEPKFTRNYLYPEDASAIDNMTPQQRLSANVEALEVVRTLMKEGREATAEEREILGKYRGWGGVELGRAYSTDMMRRSFTDRWGTPTEQGKLLGRLADVIDELDPKGERGVLSAINRAALTSYYTPTGIAKVMNRFAELAGFKGGSMLDPSMGNGVFEGTMSKGVQQRTMIHGIELDWLTGQIARNLYPDANVLVTGYEQAGTADNAYDVVMSNIPFGSISVTDKTWKHDSSPVRKAAQGKIHNYFAVKMLDNTRPGGLCVIMTSNAILDTKGNQIIREHLADQAEVLGVVRLPDNTFKGAGTSVVTDVIFLRKYKDDADRAAIRGNEDYTANIEKPFLSSGELQLTNPTDGKTYKVAVNGYFTKNKGMMIGDAKAGGQYRADEFGLGSSLGTDELANAMSKIVEKKIVGDRKGKLFDTHKTEREVHQAVSEAYKGDGNFISSGNIVEQDGMFGIVTSNKNKYGDVTSTFNEMPSLKAKASRIRAMLPIREAMKELIAAEIGGTKEDVLKELRKKLQGAYDAYVKKFGHLNNKENDFLTEDIDGYTLRSLEKMKDGKFAGLSDIFTKNTIKPALDLSTAKTPQDAISLSLAEYGEINPSFMEDALGASWAEQCGESLFRTPFTEDVYETADAYLSGDVKTKLEQAREAAKQDKAFERNVEALEAVQPKDIPFDEISIRMGARWIPADVYTDFMYDMFGIHKNDWKGNKSGVEYMPEVDQYVVNVANNELGGEADAWRTSRRAASDVFTAALQDKSLSVFDTIKEDGVEKKILNKEETELLNNKIQDLRTAFEDWLSQNPEREEMLMRMYNDKFNRTVLRKFDGSHLNVAGLMGKELRPHQKDAVWMLVNNRGGIVDHIVGAGKTLVMQSAIMEMRRMGIAKKPMIIGLKATVAQIAKEFREAYPAARILAPTEKDFAKENRKKFMSQIALNDYDCVILSHDQYCMLPHTEEVERGVIDEQMMQLDAAIEYLYGQSDKSQLTKKQIKGLEKRKANLEAKLDKLLDRKIDREFTFEGLGVDYLFVDECQHFKSLPYVSTYDRVAGLGDKQGSQRAIALLNGVRYLQRMHQGDRGTVFLSGTTISNSLSEIYHLLNYLRPSEMERLGMTTFDAWAGNYAIHTAELEYGVTNELKEKDRFRSLTNIPELSKMYAEIADVRNDMNLQLPKPKMRSHVVTVPQSDIMQEINAEIVKMVKNKDGMYFGIDSKDTTPWGLLASTLSAKAAINPRLIDEAYDSEGGKIPAVCENVKKIYDQFAGQKGTQLIFCDTGVSGKGKKYDAYSDIINRLVNDYGIPRKEIADIHEASTDEKRKALFAKVNDGSVRILIGGTKNMGTGVNVQKRIVAMHHVDVPWTPADREQREGRGVRQGNEIARDFNDDNVDVYFYATEGSLDMYKYQLQETKGKLFAQFKSGTIGERTFDEGDAEGDFDPAEVVAMLSGNPVIFEKSKQDKKVEKLRRAKRAYESDWQRRRSRYEELQTKKRNFERLLSLNSSDVRDLERGGFTPDEEGKYPATVTVSIKDDYASSRSFDKPKEAGEYIHSLLKQGKKVQLSGFNQKANVSIPITDAGLFGKPVAELDSYGGIKYSVEVSDDDTAAGVAFRNLLQKVYSNRKVYERNLEEVNNQLNGADPGENKFPKQAELDEALKEKKRLDDEYKKLSAEEASEEDKSDDSIRFRDGESNEDLLYRIREDVPPRNTGIGYKVFVLKDGKLYPPMVANPDGAETPTGVWLDADAAPVAGLSKTGRQQVKAGGKGTQGGSGKLAYRPGWHLGEIPYALQFNRINPETGEKELFPANFVWAEVEYANDVDYQDEAMKYGMNANGKFQHSLAGLPRVPENGAYKYRTNPNPQTDPWIITGAMKVNRLLKPSEVDELVTAAGREPQQRQDGAVTDAEIEALNEDIDVKKREGDDLAGMTYEESLASARRVGYTKRQHDAMLKRQWRRMHERAEDTVSKLGLAGRVTILDNADGLKGRKAKAKGWYDAKIGKIVVVLGNHHGTNDVVRTILHEGVAHYGLRALFGENFNQFLDNVYQNADMEIRRAITEMAKRHGWDFRVATEEYLASLAEDTDFERAMRQGWWSRIKSLFLDLLHNIGLDGFFGVTLTDNELRYILWRSYENLTEPGRYNNLFREAKDISKKLDLKLASYDRELVRIHKLGRIDSSSNIMRQTVVADSGIRFRDGDFGERDRVTARDAYERMVSSGTYQFREAVQDSMLGLRKLYEAILGKKDFRIEDVAGYENAYLAENRMSSVNAAEQHEYYNEYMRPLLEAIGKITGNSNGAREALTDYMMAKHGLERNLVFAERDAREAEAGGSDYADAYAKCRERDYSGLTALTGEDDVATAEAKAQQIVDDFEAAYDVTDLWDCTREATQATLEKIYKSGLLNRERYESIRDMFQYYIPLQGWDETTSDEVYGYLTSKNGPLTGSPIKHATGRKSKADDPISTIAMMADTAIRHGNRNLMKQRFLNFVLNNPSDLVSVNDLWLQYDATTDEWVPVFADLEADDSAADVERKVEAFEQRMEKLAETDPDKYKRGRDAQNIPYKVIKGNFREHQVLVKRDGRTYVLTINGNPRAAQALNGLTNPDVEQGGAVRNTLKAGEYVNRQLSAFYTTRNPDFVVSNFLRDMLYSNCMTWVKESPRYALGFHKNFGKVNPAKMRQLLGKWENGTLDMSDKTEQMFYQFMRNGGETGYTSVRDIDEHKKAVVDELKKQGSLSRRAWSALGMQFDLLNRSVENCARFAAFMTSRKMGRTIDRSIYDAKEVSVNFNKKGSGGKMVNATGQTTLGKIGSYMGSGGRLLFVFWNAGVQGMTNFGRAGRRHPAKAIAGASTMFMLGYIIPQLAAMLGGGDGDDDDKSAYYNLPEYVRRSNICFRAGEQWVTIPLPIEFRAIYGLGELASGVISNNEHYEDNELAFQIASQVSQMLPLDMLEGGGGIMSFIPSIAKPFTEAYIMNKGWTGLPIYKDTPFNKNDPEWTKAYKSADKTLVGVSKWLNEATGGDDFKKGAIDINPAKIEYMLSGYFGGYFSTANKLKKMGETAIGDREFDWRNMLIANRIVKTGDERTEYRKLQNEYFKYLDEYEETKRLLHKYENAANEGMVEYAEKINLINNSPEYLRYEILDGYKDDINAYREDIAVETNEDEKEKLRFEMYEVMREAVDALHKVEN